MELLFCLSFVTNVTLNEKNGNEGFILEHAITKIE